MSREDIIKKSLSILFGPSGSDTRVVRGTLGYEPTPEEVVHELRLPSSRSEQTIKERVESTWRILADVEEVNVLEGRVDGEHHVQIVKRRVKPSPGDLGDQRSFLPEGKEP